MPLVEQARSKGGFALGDYVEVKDRIKMFYTAFPDGALVTDRAELWMDQEETPRVVVKALAYRTPDDPHPGVGWSWLELPGKTSYTRGSELENAETSAWGRAIGSLGIALDKSIASADEIKNKSGAEIAAEETAPPNPDGSLIGTVTEGKNPADLQLRYEPDGTGYTGFALTQGRKRLQVVAISPLAEALQPFLAGLVGQRVTVWGTVEMVPWMKDGRKMPEYQRLQLARIQTADWTLPAQDVDTIPMFSDEEAAAILAAEEAEAAR